MSADLVLDPNRGGVLKGGERLLQLDLEPQQWRKVLAASGAGGLFPSATKRSAWQTLLSQPWPRSHREAIRQRVQDLAYQPWPALPARLLRRFARDGDRSEFQEVYFSRRERITDLALLVGMDNDPALVDDLVDGLWLLCEESSWCLPAHWHLAALPRRAVQDLPPAAEQVDLFAAETAALLALACDLCREALDDWSSELIPRIHREIQRRCLDPVLNSEQWFWWDGHHNWSPWIVANLLSAGAVVEKDRQRDCLLTARLSGVLQRYLDHIPTDGYCDEGPSYWNAGTGMSVVALEILRQRSDGAISWLTVPKLRAMGDYLTSTYLGHGRWISCADSKPQLQIHPEIPILLGQGCGLPDLEQRGWECHQAQGHSPINPLMGGGGLGPRLRRLWWISHDDPPAPQGRRMAAAKSSPDTWFASGQLAILREHSSPGEGCCVAVKFGHNRENHNHLDVGQVIVHWDHLPLIIDPGVNTYCSDHFSPRRYSVPWVGSWGHNAPIINGQGQTPGTGFGYFVDPAYEDLDLAASKVCYSSTWELAQVHAELSPCYPQADHLLSCHRSVSLRRQGPAMARIVDTLHCAQPAKLSIAWLSACQPHSLSPQGWIWPCSQGQIMVQVTGASEITCQTIALDDLQLRSGWGPYLWRIDAKSPLNAHNSICLTITRGRQSGGETRDES